MKVKIELFPTACSLVVLLAICVVNSIELEWVGRGWPFRFQRESWKSEFDLGGEVNAWLLGINMLVCTIVVIGTYRGINQLRESGHLRPEITLKGLAAMLGQSES